MELKIVKIKKPEEVNLIFGMSHFHACPVKDLCHIRQLDRRTSCQRAERRTF